MAGRMKVKFRLEGVEKLQRAIKHWGDAAFDALEKGLYQEAERIMAKSKTLCPVDTGALRSSGHVQLPVVGDKRVSIQFGYGGVAGASSPSTVKKFTGKAGRVVKRGEQIGYAVWVHEDLTKFHPVGQAKFLEEPYVAAARSMPKRLAQVIWRESKKTAGGK